MSKTVLIIEMPSSCEKCRLHSFVGKDCDVICGVQGKTQSYEDAYKSKPDWCPLVPLPEQKPFIGIDAIKSDFLSGRIDEALHESARLGWNACLDAICGK